MSKELTLQEEYNINRPKEVLEVSKKVKQYVVEQGLYVSIQGKNYVLVEGWQFAGALFGLIPKVKEVQNLSSDKEVKWRTDIELVNLRDEKVVGVGIALCSSLESKKKTFDEYAILSMSQTRAIGKAYRNLIGYVMKLAGYQATPAEEILQTEEPVRENTLFKKTYEAIKVLTGEARDEAIKNAIEKGSFTDEEKNKLSELCLQSEKSGSATQSTLPISKTKKTTTLGTS